MGKLLTSGPIRRILSQIQNVRGAIHVANDPESDMSFSLILLFNRALQDFQRNPNGVTDVRSYLVQVRKKFYKDLSRERMELVTARAKDADRKR